MSETHLTVSAFTQEQIALFGSKVARGDAQSCWLWSGGITSRYGAIRIDGKQWVAHRLAWVIANAKDIPYRMEVCHSCDTNLCCNPGHLFLGTGKDNQRDCSRKGRKPHGSDHWNRIVSEAEIPDIRRRYDAKERVIDIAAFYGISKDTVHQIGKRRTWLHVPEDSGELPTARPKVRGNAYFGRGAKPKPERADLIPFFPLPGYPDVVLSEKQVACFWRKIKIGSADECWPWQASGTRGYGRLGLGRRMFFAHRVAWLLHTREAIPDGMVVSHRCDNPPCCNPSHLVLKTTLANNRERANKGRSARGERHPNSKMTEADVRLLRKLHTEGLNAADLAEAFGIGETAFYQIVNRVTWKEVPDN